MSARRMTALALGVTLIAGASANAAPPGPRDPDWPCQQIKVPELSLAAVWTGPAVDTQNTDWQNDQAVADLVHEIVQRRVPLAEAQDKIQAFAQQASDQKQQKLLGLIGGVFSVLDAERATVIAGLDRFGARQKELAAGVREDSDKLRQLQANPDADAGAVNQLLQQVTWEAEVLQDRRKALSYACDVPSKIEQRLFALAHTIQQNLQ